jgi:hypothetical protein
MQGRAKAGDILFLMQLFEGELHEKDLKADSVKLALLKKVKQGDTKVLLKILDKLYANQQSVDVTSGGEKLSILELALKELSHEREDDKTSSKPLQRREPKPDPVNTTSVENLRVNIQEALQ